MNYDFLERFLEIDRLMTRLGIPSRYDRSITAEFNVQAYGPDDPFTLTWGYVPDSAAVPQEGDRSREALAVMFAFPGQSAIVIDYNVTGWGFAFTLVGPVVDEQLQILGDLTRPVCMKLDISCPELANRARVKLDSDREAYRLIELLGIARKHVQEPTSGSSQSPESP